MDEKYDVKKIKGYSRDNGIRKKKSIQKYHSISKKVLYNRFDICITSVKTAESFLNYN